jgi:short-chain fatty acids transporter
MLELEHTKNRNLTTNRNFTTKFTELFETWMPDSMTIAFILLIVAAILAKIFTGCPVFVSTSTQKSIADSLGGTFWNLLTFSMQVVLVTILGTVLASSPPVKKLLQKFCSLPKTTNSAYIMCALLGFVLAWVHWAVGWMGCIVIGKEMLIQAKKRGIPIHTPSFVPALFCTSLVGGSGISATPVLFASTPGYLKSLVGPDTAQLVKEQYSILDTAIYAEPIITVALSALVVLGVIMLMSPERKGQPIEEINAEQEKFYSIEVQTDNLDLSTPAKRMSNSIVIQGIIVILMGYWIIVELANKGFLGLSLNSYNFLVLTLTLACCMRPRIFTELFIGTVQSAWAFIIQFPFYAAIFGVIVGTGFDKVISQFFLSFATQQTWPSVAMLYSSIMNIFVPSAGSKFIIEAPYILPITFNLHSKVETILMAYSYGDIATNMLTPFWWAIPCGLFKIDFHKVMPYAVVASLSVTVFYFFALLLW